MLIRVYITDHELYVCLTPKSRTFRYYNSIMLLCLYQERVQVLEACIDEKKGTQKTGSDSTKAGIQVL